MYKTCITFSLQDLEDFIETTKNGLQQEVKEGDYDALVQIMGHLMAVRDRQSV